MFNLCHTYNFLQNPTATHIKCAWIAQCKGYSFVIKLRSCVVAECNNTIHPRCQTGWESLYKTGQCEVGPYKYYCPDHHPNNTKSKSKENQSDSNAENQQNCKTAESAHNPGNKNKDQGNDLESRLRNKKPESMQNEVRV